ncbi:MAG: nucleoside deaminase [Bacteroidota bacterium]
MEHRAYLRLAVEEAMNGMRAGEGGPFGALIVRDGEILGRGHNTVLKAHDPSAHAEVNAIRDACNHLKDHHLTGASIYTNFEPCPMCLGAIYWADIRSIFFCGGRKKARDIGFMDSHMYDEFARAPEAREMRSSQMWISEMDLLLDAWNNKKGKNLY